VGGSGVCRTVDDANGKLELLFGSQKSAHFWCGTAVMMEGASALR